MVNMPIKKFRAGSMETAIWSNRKKTEEGEIEFKTVSMTRSWKRQGENTWRHDTINFKRNDLQKAILVLQKAQEELLLSDEKEEEEDE